MAISTAQTQTTEEYFDRLHAETAEALHGEALGDNPNLTYGQVLIPGDLRILSLFTNPELQKLLPDIYDQQTITNLKGGYDTVSKKLQEFNIPPHPFTPVPPIPPGERATRPIRPTVGAPTGLAPMESGTMAVKHKQNIANYGLNPLVEANFNTEVEPWLDTKLRWLASWAPRNLSTRDFKHLQKELGIKGDVRYINPSKPELGLKFRHEGQKEWKVYDLPYVTGRDFGDFLAQEAPSILGDVLLTIVGTKKLQPFYTALKTGPGKRALQILGMSGLSATGAAGGDLVRLLIGKKLGAHDRGNVEMLKESGMMGALAFGGTALISTAQNLLPMLYRKILGKEVPENFYKELDELYQRAASSERGITIVDEGSPYYGQEGAVTLKDIRVLAKELAEKMDADFAGTYKPTLSGATGLPSAADFELAFLKNATDDRLINLYRGVKEGNQHVIHEMFKALNEVVGERLTTPATSATVAKGIRGIIQQDLQQMENVGRDVIENLSRRLGGAEDIAVGGQALLKKVRDTRYGNELLPQTRTRLAEIKEEYLAEPTRIFTETVNSPKYAGIKTGSGYTRGPTTAWLRVNRRKTDELFKDADSGEAKDLLFELTNAPIIRRLRGLGPAPVRNAKGEVIVPGKGGFKSGDFGLEELNKARVKLNSFAHTTNNQVAKEHALNLQHGITDQMNKLIREEGAKRSGYGVNTKNLTKWMDENNWGRDITLAWEGQLAALETSKARVITHILNSDAPEALIPYLLETGTVGSKINTPVSEIMTVLNETGAKEIPIVRRAFAEFIKRNILDQPGTPLEIGQAYRTFFKDNEGTINAIFDKDIYKTFPTAKQFKKNVLDKLETVDQQMKHLTARFGTVDNPDPTAGDIVLSILNSSKAQKQSGILLQDMDYLLKILNRKGNKELQKEASAVAKRWIASELLEPTPGGFGYRLNTEKFNKLIHEGFGPEEVVGPLLTFENFYAPLLGKDGKQYVKNLKILNNMLQREVGAEPTGRFKALYEEAIPDTESWRRMLIKPLTQLGRRLTFLEKRLGERSQRYVGNMLMDPELFNKSMMFAQGRINLEAFTRFLVAHHIVSARDMGNELRYYNPNTKKHIKTRPYQEKVVTDPYLYFIENWGEAPREDLREELESLIEQESKYGVQQ
jgi:hypothetical protein